MTEAERILWRAFAALERHRLLPIGPIKPIDDFWPNEFPEGRANIADALLMHVNAAVEAIHGKGAYAEIMEIVQGRDFPIWYVLCRLSDGRSASTTRQCRYDS